MTHLAQLHANWGVAPTMFPEYLVDLDGVDLAEATLEPLLSALPAEKLVLRTSPKGPGGTMDRLQVVPGKGVLEVLHSDCAHLMALDLQQTDRGFARLLERFVAQVRPVVEAHGQRIARPMVGLFISSPGSIARYHADPEHNFLFQIRGSKTLRLFPGESPHFPATAKERLFCDRIHYIDYAEELETGGVSIDLGPGMSSYQPMLRPHWVRCHDELSVSIGFSLLTDSAVRQGRVHRFNRRLRKLGLEPAPPGRGAVRDGFKQLVIRTFSREH